MDIHHLKIFAAVYKNRSFSRASEQLHISQPTISEHIKNLEHELGCILFDRLGRSIVPTKEAEVIFPHALQIIENIGELKDEVTKAGNNVKGEIIIGASTIPGTYILPAIAADFKKRFPEVSFEILIEDSKKITDMVLHHEIQLGVVGAIMETGKLDYRPFIEDELIMAAPPNLVKKRTLDFRELREIPFILREKGSGTRKTMEEFLRKKGIGTNNLEVVAYLGSTDSVKQAIKVGLGVSILSRIAVKDELKNKSLKQIHIKDLKMKRYFHLVKHKRRSLPNHYNEFYRYILQHGDN